MDRGADDEHISGACLAEILLNTKSHVRNVRKDPRRCNVANNVIMKSEGTAEIRVDIGYGRKEWTTFIVHKELIFPMIIGRRLLKKYSTQTTFDWDDGSIAGDSYTFKNWTETATNKLTESKKL